MSKKSDLPLILKLKKDVEKYTTRKEKQWQSFFENYENEYLSNLEKTKLWEVVASEEEFDLDNVTADWSQESLFSLGASCDPYSTSNEDDSNTEKDILGQLQQHHATFIVMRDKHNKEDEDDSYTEKDFLGQLQQHHATFIEMRDKHNKEGGANEIGFFDDRLFEDLSKDTHSDQSTELLEFQSCKSSPRYRGDETYSISSSHLHRNDDDDEFDFLSSPLLYKKLKSSSCHGNTSSSCHGNTSSSCHENTSSSCHETTGTSSSNEISTGTSLTGDFDDGFIENSDEENCNTNGKTFLKSTKHDSETKTTDKNTTTSVEYLHYSEDDEEETDELQLIASPKYLSFFLNPNNSGDCNATFDIISNCENANVEDKIIEDESED